MCVCECYPKYNDCMCIMQNRMIRSILTLTKLNSSAASASTGGHHVDQADEYFHVNNSRRFWIATTRRK